MQQGDGVRKIDLPARVGIGGFETRDPCGCAKEEVAENANRIGDVEPTRVIRVGAVEADGLRGPKEQVAQRPVPLPLIGLLCL